MRRSLLVLLLSVGVCLFATASTLATGPGGWNRLGTDGTPSGASLNGHVTALNADTPGALYVGGSFTNAGGIASADRIAKWDGTKWSALGTTPLGTGSVFAIATYAGKVYAGGTFVNAGGQAAADYLAVFDGVSWKPFCNSTTRPAFDAAALQVLALQVVGSTLYVGGTFQNANSDRRADYLIACDLATGTPSVTVDTDGDFTGPVYDLAATPDGTLYAGGTFTNLDHVATADRVASYNGTTWQGLGTTAIGGIVRALHAQGTDVYISSDGVNIGGVAQADHLVKWNGSGFSAVGANGAGTDGYFPATTYINALTSSGSLLFAAGSWQNADGKSTGDVVASFDGSKWRPIGSNGANDGPWVGDTQALEVFGGQLYAGGAMTNAGGDRKANFATSRSLRLPDALIATATGGYVGDDVYNKTAVGQTKTIQIARGSSSYLPITIQNEGLLPASFRLKGTGAATGYTVTYVNYYNGANITTAVRNGSFSTGILAPGQSFAMKIIVKLSASAATTGAFVLTARSTAGTPADAVRGVVRAT
ncbi:MAG: hypothetical protein QOH73_1288 [Gaiellaceae bacterium]|jgi:hypothetical protein|nr:hypothetical protein [Gaiellaceae bacterium]